MPKIINIAGQARHGKTSAANILKDILEKRGKRVLIINYADYLKFICKEYFGWDGTKSEQGRTILQKIGTDIVREREPNFWVHSVGNFIDIFREDFDFVLIGDCRFVNECEYFKFDYDVLNIKVIRNNFDNGLTEEQKNHPSERDLDNYSFDVEIISENGIENLEKTISILIKGLISTHWLD